MSLWRYRGLVLVALWQTAPPLATVDSAGRIQGVLGFGAGSYEDVRVSCEGDVTGTSSVRYSGYGTRIDAWPTRDLVVTGVAGSVEAGGGTWTSPYYGGRVGLELQYFGIGAGAFRVVDATNAPTDDHWTATSPTGYLRVGNRDRLHATFEIMPPDPPLMGTGVIRFGLGHNRGHLRGPRWHGGVAVCHFLCDLDSNPSAFLEAAFPVLDPVDLELRGLVGSGVDSPNTGLAIGARIHFRQP